MNEKMNGLSPTEALLLTRLAGSNQHIFAFDDAVAALGKKPVYIRQLLYRLARKKWILRLEKGKYLIVPLEAGEERAYTEHELLIAPVLVQPYYIGYRTALSFYGYTEQSSPVIYVATTKRKMPVTIQGTSYHFVRLKEKKFFGFQQVWKGPNSLIVSTPEKTILDCLEHLEYVGGIVEVAKALVHGREELSLITLVEFGKQLGNRAVLQRLGYLLDFFQMAPGPLLSKIQSLIGKSFVKLDTLGGDFGHYMSKWRVRVNVPPEVMIEWQHH